MKIKECEQLECVYRLDVPHYFAKEDERVEDYYKPIFNGETKMAHLMCVNCGDEQQVYIDRKYINEMLEGKLLNEDMLEDMLDDVQLSTAVVV